MAFSFQRETGNGVTKSFILSFVGQDEGYIAEDDIEILVDGEGVSFSFISSNTVELSSAPPEDSQILIRRIVDKNRPYTDFRSGNNFGAEALNNSFLQTLYALHEILDGYFPDGVSFKQVMGFDKDVTMDGNLTVRGRLDVEGQGGDAGVITYDIADSRYLRTIGGSVDGDTSFQGNLTVSGNSASGPNAVLNKTQLDNNYLRRVNDAAENLRVLGRMAIRNAQSPDEAASYKQVVDASNALSAQIANIQGQLSGGEPLEASAFSPVSWHDQEISNSITIPANKNAWSFGPVVTIADGVVLTIGDGSFWTIADGEAQTVQIAADEGEI